MEQGSRTSWLFNFKSFESMPNFAITGIIKNLKFDFF